MESEHGLVKCHSRWTIASIDSGEDVCYRLGDILFFAVDPVGVQGHLASFPCVFFLNMWMNFDQTCIDTLLGKQKEFIRF